MAQALMQQASISTITYYDLLKEVEDIKDGAGTIKLIIRLRDGVPWLSCTMQANEEGQPARYDSNVTIRTCFCSWRCPRKGCQKVVSFLP